MHASKRPRASPRLSDAPSSRTISSTNEIRVQPPARAQDQELAPMYKSSRTSTHPHGRDCALLCTLPPTCNPPHNKPTPIADSRDLEIHYGKYHAHVSGEDVDLSKNVVVVSALLMLTYLACYRQHQTECHDPLAAVRKERGERIFACHLVSCPRLFSTPKARRLHLIQAHSYPKEYFFAVTNKGVGGLLKRWGDGASMIRGTWKPRDIKQGQETKITGKENMEVDLDGEEEEEDAEGEDEGEENGEGDDLDEEEGGEATPKARYNNGSNARSPAVSPKPPSPRQSSVRPSSLSYGGVDELARSMSSLSLVPPAIRFGRGGKSGGFMHPELHNPQVLRGNFGPRGRGRGRIAANVHPHTGHGRGGGHLRGFPRGTARIDVQGGIKGRDEKLA
ncbi:hypothetical protein JVT61DRAFT_392 [Boletus reticuloceps]|uniref:C2H2-type domain-containing protein n=1 Tax=Boletus reticuloceps TaxID=495285 RepID=A0A8I3AGP9_9AGAM|nr:hypothetical protein JVT61DRAFT_392 [Boletus reticuloceps]